MTFPRGPNEVSALWYAQSRLGLASGATFFWGHNLPPAGKWVFLTGRVLEKPAEFSIAFHERCREEVNFEDVDTYAIWSDCGPHFRNYKCLGTQSTFMAQELDCNVVHNFGPEAH